jgi:hypothetical protein
MELKNHFELAAVADWSAPSCSPWAALYVSTAILWATYSARMARQELGSEGRWFWSFVTNLVLCPIAILWASIFKANVKLMAHPLAGANIDRGVRVEIRWKHHKQRG